MRILFAYSMVLTCTLLGMMSGCVPVPDIAPGAPMQLVPGGTYVVCEGLWRQDNSVLSYIAPTGMVVRDAVAAVNPGLRLGDTASDIVTSGDTMWVAVSTSRSIEKYRKSTGTWIGRLSFDDGRMPSRLLLVNDTVAYSTNLSDDSITEFNPRTMESRVERLVVGPAPDGMDADDTYLYIAISGFGDLRKNEDGAGTVTVLRRRDLGVEYTIAGLPNAAGICCDRQRKRVWISYRSFVSTPSDTGGVVLWDVAARTIVQRWRFASAYGLCLDKATGSVMVLHEQGVNMLYADGGTRRLSSHASTRGNDVWYSLGYDNRSGLVWIGNARTYVTDGEAIVLDTLGEILGRYAVGVNPSAFGF